jgi:nicotinamidase-related amidase
MKEGESLSGIPAGHALLVIDMQQALFGAGNPVYEAERLIANTLALVDRAHAAGSPVFYIQHCNARLLAPESPGWQLHPGLQPAPYDRRLLKRHGSSFQDTDLASQLNVLQASNLVVTGLVSHGCITAACEDGLRLGFQMLLAEDAHSNYHRNAAQVVADVNQKLSALGVRVLPAAAIRFTDRAA